MAGIVAVDPAPLTLRELLWMAEAHREHDWGQTSSLLAATYEVHRDRKRRRRPFTPLEFNPLVQPAGESLPISVNQLTQLLTQ